MKKLFISIFVIVVVFSLAGCQKKISFHDEPASENPKVSNEVASEDNTTEQNAVKEGVIATDGENLIFISEGEEIPLALDDSLTDLIDNKVTITGDFNESGLFEVKQIQVWKQGRLFQTLNNLYLLQENGDHLLLEGSVTPEIAGQYLGREANILGSFTDKKNFKLRVLEYYIEGVKTDVWKNYENNQFGFKMQYPAGWQVKEEAVDVGHAALNVTFSRNGESVDLVLQKDIPRPALADENISKKVLPSGLVLTVYDDTSAVDGAPMTKAFLDLPDSDYDLYLAGSGKTVNQMYQTLELIQE
ncbi:MAG TPA: hypothetical protein VMX18_01250 [Candidatus Bipolaricaulota bacterium]|nr:hypothetical protein [Candidatus Bipolaricaulota bacterium]